MSVERVEIGSMGSDELEALIDEAIDRLRENAKEIGCEFVTDLVIDLKMFRVLRGLIKVVAIAYGNCVKPKGAGEE